MPGITRFYAALDRKPATFLDLLWAFEGRTSALQEHAEASAPLTRLAPTSDVRALRGKLSCRL